MLKSTSLAALNANLSNSYNWSIHLDLQHRKQQRILLAQFVLKIQHNSANSIGSALVIFLVFYLVSICYLMNKKL